MNFKDEWAENDQGERFVFTVEMQRRLSEAGLPVEPGALDELPDLAPSLPRNQSRGGYQSGGRHDGGDRRPRQERRDDDDLQPAMIQIDPESGKYLGRLKWFDTTKGYGFIARGGGEDIFFHKSEAAVDPTNLNEGQWVLYDVEEGRKGPEATDVEAYDGPMSA